MTTADGPRRADGWATSVRERLGLGRLLPLGGPADEAWIAERAAASVLRDSTAGPGAVVGRLRIGTAMAGSAPGAPGEDPKTTTGARYGTGPGKEPRDGHAQRPPAPPSALPRGPLRIEAEFAATAGRPLPTSAALLREALLEAASRRLGLDVAEVDLRVTGLLEEERTAAHTDGGPSAGTSPAGATARDRVAFPRPEVRAGRDTGAAGLAAAAVPGVVSLTRVLGAPVTTSADHVRVEVATADGHRALDVARAVRTAVTGVLEDGPPVSVLVTAVVEAPERG
ncbi:hypothetical protein [Streptomyces sp. NBC_00102]|uniref:hypothetical protein n=1 Tax=Streptomyces sp. NBC_00102 TaxID=2975652 RepID=UPI00225BE812|nr:hypothetical protein [Streptomyces sp. NBC_00102]MCX5396235.1 hypothetical protein [Streptomyces sp. NBC_00102]